MPRLHSIQALRAIAATLALISHLGVVEHRFGGGEHILPTVAYQGRAGVDLFFVISGFIMATIANGRTTPWLFLWNRATRIYPAYWVYTTIVLVVASVVPSMVNSSVTEPISVWRSYLLLPYYGPPLLGVGWTLIHEMYFYLVFALILWLGIRLQTGLLVWTATVAVLWPMLWALTGNLEDWPTLDVLFHPMTFEFILGAGAALLVQQTKRYAGRVLALGTILFLVGFVLYSARWDRPLLLGIPAAMIIYGLVGLEGLIPVPRGLVLMGDASYSTYLSHVLAINAVARTVALFHISGWLDNVLIVAGGIVVANLVGWVSFRTIEKQSLALLRGVSIQSFGVRLLGRVW